MPDYMLVPSNTKHDYIDYIDFYNILKLLRRHLQNLMINTIVCK